MLQVEEAVQSYGTSNIEISDNELCYRGTPVNICAFFIQILAYSIKNKLDLKLIFFWGFHPNKQ